MVANKKIFVRCIVAALAAAMLLLSCGKDSLFNGFGSQSYGRIAPSLMFKKGQATISIPASVRYVRIHVAGSAIDTSLTVPYSAKQAEIQNIPVGIVDVTVEGLDSINQVLYRGTASVLIEANKTAQPAIEMISTHPIVLAFTSPKDSETVADKSITLNGTLDAEYGLLTFNIGLSAITVTGDQWSKNVSLDSGTNTFLLVAVDNKGFILKDTLTVIYSPTAVDMSGPVIVLSQPKNRDTVPVTPVMVQGTVTDPSGILAVQVNRKTATLLGSAFSISEDLVAGTNTIVITAIDNSPSQNKTSDTITVILNTSVKDTVGPVLAVNTPRNGDTVSTATVMVSGTAIDISGISSVVVNGTNATVSGNAWTASVPVTLGANKIVAVATDASPQSNVSRDTIAVVYSATAQDKTLPSVAITSPSNNMVVSNPIGIAVSGTASDPAGIASVKINGISATYANGVWNTVISLTKPGDNEVRAVATDMAGNKDSTSINLKYDSTAADNIPPSVRCVSHTSGQTVSVSPILVQVTAADANGIAWVTIQGDTATLNGANYERSITLVNGPNTIKVLAQDKSSNKNIDTLTFTLTYDPSAADITPPKITLVSPTSGQVVSTASVLVQVTASDANGIAWVTIGGAAATLNGANYERSVPLVIGPNTIKVIAQDASTNHNKDSLTFTLTYDSTAADSTPPVVTLTSPANGQTFNTPAISLQGTATDANGIFSVTVNGNPATVNGTNYSFSMTLSPGTNAITIVAKDASKNKNQATLNATVTYDAPPTAAVVSAPTNITYNSVTLSWSQNSDNDFASYKVYHSTSPNVSLTGTLDTTIGSQAVTVCTIAKLQQSTAYYFKVFTFDKFPSSTPSNEVSATTAQVSPPVVSVTGPALTRDSALVNAASVIVSGTVSTVASISTVSARVNNVNATATGTASWSLTAPLNVNTWNIVQISASDNFGNVGSKTAWLYFKQPLSSPAAPVVNTFTNTKVFLSWAKVPYCSTYSVYRSMDGANGFYFCFANGLTDTTVADTGLNPDTKYWYIIRGFYSHPSGFATSDSTSKSPVTMVTTKFWFQKTYDGGGGFPTIGASVVLAPDKGYFLWGTANDVGKYGFYYQKTDSLGNPQKGSTIGTGWDNTATYAGTTSNGGFVAVGYAQASTSDMFRAFLFDASGNLTLTANTLNYSIRPYGVVQTPDNGFMVTGALKQIVGESKMFLLKTSSSVDTMWMKRFGSVGINEGRDLVKTSDGGFVIAGGQRDPVGAYVQCTIQKTNSNGDSLWRDNISITGDAWTTAAAEATDGGIITAIMLPRSPGPGSTHQIYKYTSDGLNVSWVKNWETDFYACDTVSCLRVTSDGGFIIAGTSVISGVSKAFLAKADMSGNFQWTKLYGAGQETGKSATQTPDGGYILCGTERSYSGGSPRMWLVKTDANGNTSPSP